MTYYLPDSGRKAIFVGHLVPSHRSEDYQLLLLTNKAREVLLIDILCNVSKDLEKLCVTSLIGFLEIASETAVQGSILATF